MVKTKTNKLNVKDTFNRANNVLESFGREPIKDTIIPVEALQTPEKPLNDLPVIEPMAEPAITFEDSISEIKAPPIESEASAISKRISELEKGAMGEEQRRLELEKKLGMEKQRKTVTDFAGQLKQIQAQLKAEPLQTQQDVAGKGLTKQFTSTLSMGRRRELGIKALTIQALAEAAQGNLTTSSDLVDRSIEAEFAPKREEIRIEKERLERLLPFLTDEQKQRAEIRKNALKEREDLLKEQEETKKDIRILSTSVAEVNADPLTIQRISRAESFEEALVIATPFLKLAEERKERESKAGLASEDALRQQRLASASASYARAEDIRNGDDILSSFLDIDDEDGDINLSAFLGNAENTTPSIYDRIKNTWNSLRGN